MPEYVTAHDPDDKPIIPHDAHDTVQPPGDWRGPTYYGRPQLKPSPFENWVVGGYIFLAGVSGAAALIAALADRSRAPGKRGMSRRGRYLSLLAPTLGSALLVWDLATPKRFYNMLRIAKPTSPMSIGTWTLMAFTAFSGVSAVAQFVSDRVPGFGWLRRAGRVAQVPAAAAGAGLSTYTASLLAATSTPLWAAAPRALGARFGASSIAAGAAALSLGERSPRGRRQLDTLAVAALAAELAATMASHHAYERAEVSEALDGNWGLVERWGATGLGVILPLGMHMLAPRLSRPASFAVLAGSLLLRVSIMAAGDESARRPEVSFRFSQPKHLPR